MRIHSAAELPDAALPDLPGGIFPYVNGLTSTGTLQGIVGDYGFAAVPGKRGVLLASEVPDTLADPAQYAQSGAASGGLDSPLFDYDPWLERQRHAKVPVVLTDSGRIKKGDRASLRSGLSRWNDEGDPSLAVLPVENWWLRAGLGQLVDDARSAGRPVALVLHHFFNGLDDKDAVGGLLRFTSALGDVPVVLLRCDVSGVGAVAHGARAAFIGSSAALRHGPMPRRPSASSDEEPDLSPRLFVPALHNYFKASFLPAIDHADAGLLACHDQVCRGASLLDISRLAETDPAAARARASLHDMASHERVARLVFGSAEPRDAWWEMCKAGADTAAVLLEHGISLPDARWRRQWLALGSPAHAPLSTR